MREVTGHCVKTVAMMDESWGEEELMSRRIPGDGALRRLPPRV